MCLFVILGGWLTEIPHPITNGQWSASTSVDTNGMHVGNRGTESVAPRSLSHAPQRSGVPFPLKDPSIISLGRTQTGEQLDLNVMGRSPQQLTVRRHSTALFEKGNPWNISSALQSRGLKSSYGKKQANRTEQKPLQVSEELVWNEELGSYQSCWPFIDPTGGLFWLPLLLAIVSSHLALKITKSQKIPKIFFLLEHRNEGKLGSVWYMINFLGQDLDSS